MAKPLTVDQFRGGGKSLTLNGKTFPVGPQGSAAFKKPTGTGAIALNQAGQVFEGYDISGRDVLLQADNITVRNCMGDAAGLHTVWQMGQAKGGKVEFCRFDSQAGKFQSGRNNDLVMSDNGLIVIANNIFLDSPVDCLNLACGIIEHNAIVRAQFSSGAHSDGVSIHRTTGPVIIRENYIDFILHTPKIGTNACVKIVSHFGRIVDVTVEDNVLVGGGFNVYCGDGGGGYGTPVNAKIRRNLMGLTEYGNTENGFVFPGKQATPAQDIALHGQGFELVGNSLFSAAPEGVVSVAATQLPKPPETPPVVTPSDPSPIPAPVPTPVPVPGGKTLTADQVLAIKTAIVAIAKILE